MFKIMLATLIMFSSVTHLSANKLIDEFTSKKKKKKRKNCSHLEEAGKQHSQNGEKLFKQHMIQEGNRELKIGEEFYVKYKNCLK